MRYNIFSAAAFVCPFRRFSLVLGALLLSASLAPQARSAAAGETPSALAADAQGWTDILPSADLKSWSRVPVPPTGKLGRAQWHVDAENKVLVCDGDGGHDMLLWDKE